MALEMLAVALAAVVVLLALAYRYLTSTYNYFQKRGIAGPKPSPIFGTWLGVWKQFQGEHDLINIREYGQVYGSFNGRTPTLVVAEPAVVRTVLGREAASFRDSRECSVRSSALRQGLLALGRVEKADPTKSDPSFLVPEKLRAVAPTLLKAAQSFTSDLKTTAEGAQGRVDIVVQVSNFLGNVLALGVFGEDLEKSPETKDQLSKHLEKVFFNANSDSILSLLPFLYPSLSPLDNYIMSKESRSFFTNLFKLALEKRRNSEMTSEVAAPDFVGICVAAATEERAALDKLKVDAEGEATAAPMPTLTDDRLAAECLAVVMSTALITKKLVTLSAHALAASPEVQDKLHAELAGQQMDSFSYEAIQSAKYLNMFISEVERIYPSEFRMERICCDTMEVDKYKIDSGSVVAIPVYAIHHLQDFYPEPEKFDPERFSPENDEKRVLGTYLPYGQLGSTPANLNVHFGVLAAKMAVASVVKKIKFSPAEETQIPPEFEKRMTGVLRPCQIIITAETRT